MNYETRKRQHQEAIKALSDMLDKTYDYMGGSGGPPDNSIRIQAAKSLGNYLPHPDAVKALTRALNKSSAHDEVKVAVAAALSKGSFRG